MIKKILGLGIILLGLFGFSGTFGYDYDIAYQINYNRYLYPLTDLRFNGYSYNIDFNGNFTTTYGSDTYNGLYIPINDQRGTTYNTVSVFRNDNKLYVYSRDTIQGYFLSFCEGTFDNFATDNNDINDCLLNNPYNGGNTGNFIDFEQFISSRYLNNIQGVFYVSREGGGWSGNPIPFGFLYNDGTFVIFQPDTTLLTGTLGFNFGIPPSSSMSFSNFSTMSSYMESAPVVGGGGNGGNGGTLIPTNSDVDKVINYYETRFNWNEDMCYVGTNDLTSVYGTSGVDFNSGTGDTIFGLYYSLYNSYGSSIINNVGKFINVRTLNYGQWFYEGDNIKWLATDNGPDTNVSYIYTGFTFPFANKPVAIYFMASNLYDGYSRESSQGVDMAFYCYSKLNYDNINSGTIDYKEIKEQVSENILGRIDTYVNYHINPNTNNSQYQIPTSGSFWDSFGTGYEDTDIELDTTFSDFYTRITNIFQNYTPQYSTGIIPDYILYALIFLILFRIMKH